MVGIALSFGLMMFARFFKLLVNLYGLLFLLILPATIYYGHIVNDVTQTRFYAVYEHMLSITDFSGTRTYKNRESMSTGANNRFRLEWWRTVIQDTLTTSPLTGLGFGYDLSDRFVLDYYQNFGEGFRTRSPHSIFLTIFGRTGVIGSLLFLILLATMVRQTISSIILTRQKSLPTRSFQYWCLVWVIFGSASFGVVLEGPMGAIPFWTFLGLANALTHKEAEESTVKIPELDAMKPSYQPAT